MISLQACCCDRPALPGVPCLPQGLLSEDAACDDLASVLHLVPERSLLCVWTRDSHRSGKTVLLPYAAVTDVDMEVRGVAVVAKKGEEREGRAHLTAQPALHTRSAVQT